MKNKIDPSKLVERPYPSGECICHCHKGHLIEHGFNYNDCSGENCLHCTKSGSLKDLMGTGEVIKKNMEALDSLEKNWPKERDTEGKKTEEFTRLAHLIKKHDDFHEIGLTDTEIGHLALIFREEIQKAREEGEAYKGKAKREAYQQGYEEGKREMIELIKDSAELVSSNYCLVGSGLDDCNACYPIQKLLEHVESTLRTKEEDERT